MSSPPLFSQNGWRRLADGRLQHISGAQFRHLPHGEIVLIKESLSVFIQNLKQEGVHAERAEKLLHKLAQQAKDHFLGLH